MRLFKRNLSSDVGPQLVSATPITHDGVTASVSLADNVERAEKKQHSEADTTNETISQSSVSARKGISTWGRKVGRRWDQLKRSDSSELLSVSGRRRRWSPNRKTCPETSEEKGNGTNGAPTPIPESSKPKKISRVESLRNLFRASDRSSNFLSNDISSRTVTIQEEDITCISHYPMEKALSDGALKNVPFRMKSDDEGQAESRRGSVLHEKKKRLSRSIHDLQEQQRVLDFILTNHEILNTEEGTAFVKETLGKAPEYPESRLNASSSNSKRHKISTETRDFQHSTIRRNLFNTRTRADSDNSEPIRRSCPTTGLEDLMSNLRLGCDESGYDSDSTRAGADSPDSAGDYRGVDLSLPVSTPKKDPSTMVTEENNNTADVSSLEDRTITPSKSFLSESIRTDMTTLMSDDDDTDTCDEDTFDGFMGFQSSYGMSYAKSELSLSRDFDQDLGKFRQTMDLGKLKVSSSRTFDVYRSHSGELDRTPRKKAPPKPDNVVSLRHPVKSQNVQKVIKESAFSKNRRHSPTSILNLLDNAASPCKDSPPASKVPSTASTNSTIRYYSSKRSRADMESESNEELVLRNGLKKSVVTTSLSRVSHVPTPAKTLVRRELKTMKLTVEKAGNLGISVERREAARPFYVISRMDANGEAARSKQFRIGDEIVRVCGRRLRGMSLAEARNILKNCVGTVELQIAREPTFTFGEEIGDTWGDTLVRTRSDSEVWTLKEPGKTSLPVADNSTLPVEARDCDQQQNESITCKVVGALTKSGQNLSVCTMDSTQGEDVDKDCDQKMTGMKKFQVVRKRQANSPSFNPRRATSLSMDLLTVVMEKGAGRKKLGFSIVGGSDTNKGSMGIFVKDIMVGGQAADEGTLKAGDEILAINGASMDGLTHAKALQMFKTVKAGKMVLHVGRRDPTHKRLCPRRYY